MKDLPVKDLPVKNTPDHCQDYILVIGQSAKSIKEQSAATVIAQELNCPVVSIASPWQAIAKAQANPPYLVILSGDEGQTWAPQTAREIKQSVQSQGVVVVALTTSSEHSWADDAERAEIDGYFVEPMSADVLSALNESAIAKKKCLQLALA